MRLKNAIGKFLVLYDRYGWIDQTWFILSIKKDGSQVVFDCFMKIGGTKYGLMRSTQEYGYSAFQQKSKVFTPEEYHETAHKFIRLAFGEK